MELYIPRTIHTGSAVCKVTLWQYISNKRVRLWTLLWGFPSSFNSPRSNPVLPSHFLLRLPNGRYLSRLSINQSINQHVCIFYSPYQTYLHIYIYPIYCNFLDFNTLYVVSNKAEMGEEEEENCQGLRYVICKYSHLLHPS